MPSFSTRILRLPGTTSVRQGAAQASLPSTISRAPDACAARDVDPAAVALLERPVVLRGRARLDLDGLLERDVALLLDVDRVLAGLEVPREGRAPDGADVLAVDEDLRAHGVRGDLDPAEVVLLGQRDVDVDELVGLGRDRPLLGLEALRLEDEPEGLGLERALPRRLAERAALLVVEVDRRALRLRVDDDEPLREEGGQRGRLERGRRDR